MATHESLIIHHSNNAQFREGLAVIQDGYYHPCKKIVGMVAHAQSLTRSKHDNHDNYQEVGIHQ